MNKKILILWLFVLVITNNLSAAIDSTKVLFIGNSLTYFNDMPLMFKGIANNKGQTVTVNMYTPGGSGIVNHYVDPNIYALISGTIWDIIIIQPGTGESAGASYPVDTTVERTRVILDSIYHYNQCTKVYLYEIPYGVPSATDYATYFSVQSMIKDSVTKMANALHLQMLPAGECARAYYSMSQNLLLHNSYNDVHPNTYGSYLTALSFYAGIYQESVSSCTYYSTISQDTALKFYNIVDTVVLNHFADWRINTYNLHADFTFNQFGSTLAFANLSVNYDSLKWNFGDGNTSNTYNPNHQYVSNGIYTIKLFSYKNTCVDSVQKQITVLSTTINVPSQINNNINLFPNPVKENLFIKGLKNNDKVTVIDVYGQTIYCNVINTDEYHQVNISQLKSGLYFIKLNLEIGETLIYKFLKY